MGHAEKHTRVSNSRCAACHEHACQKNAPVRFLTLNKKRVMPIPSMRDAVLKCDFHIRQAVQDACAFCLINRRFKPPILKRTVVFRPPLFQQTADKRKHTYVGTITELIWKKTERVDRAFRLRFAANSPVPELVLSQQGLMGNILIRGEDFGGRNQALIALCGDAAMAGLGVIYITEGLVPSLATTLREKAREAFGPARYHALNVAIEKGGKLKVSRKAVSVLQFNSHHAPGSVDEIRRRLPGILDWIGGSDFEHPLLMVLENYHLYCKEFVTDLLGRTHTANCAVILTTLGSDPRVGLIPEIEPGVFEKCATILDLNRRRAGDVRNTSGIKPEGPSYPG
jgi:hypothetical protein